MLVSGCCLRCDDIISEDDETFTSCTPSSEVIQLRQYFRPDNCFHYSNGIFYVKFRRQVSVCIKYHYRRWPRGWRAAAVWIPVATCFSETRHLFLIESSAYSQILRQPTHSLLLVRWWSLSCWLSVTNGGQTPVIAWQVDSHYKPQLSTEGI